MGWEWRRGGEGRVSIGLRFVFFPLKWDQFTVYRLTLRHLIRISEAQYIMIDILFY